MKIITWNVNGIRACLRKGFADFLVEYQPDIVCLQEIKISDKAILKEKFDFKNYKEYWNPAQRPGYSGTAVLIAKSSRQNNFYNSHSSSRQLCPKNSSKYLDTLQNFLNKSDVNLNATCKSYFVANPNDKLQITNELQIINCTNGFGIEEFDCEGRVQTLEFAQFYLVNLYFPNSNHELSRLEYKERFNAAFLKHIQKLEKKKPVIACGDFNVAHQEIDLKNPKSNIGNAGFTDEEREWMDKFMKAGFVDIFRKMYPEKIQYSWWSYRFNARARNIGWRIDYFLVSDKLVNSVDSISILDQVIGSDHAPVLLRAWKEINLHNLFFSKP